MIIQIASIIVIIVLTLVLYKLGSEYQHRRIIKMSFKEAMDICDLPIITFINNNVKLNFLLGLRVGELVALKWDDVVDNKLHVVREEVRDQTTNSLQVVEHTKTNHDRFVTLVPKAKAILELIENQSEYIFMRDGARITARQINYVLEKYAERMGVSTKSSHKIRKTYASNLNAKGVPLDCIREELGHADASTTLAYIYNPLTETETYNLIVSAL